MKLGPVGALSVIMNFRLRVDPVDLRLKLYSPHCLSVCFRFDFGS